MNSTSAALVHDDAQHDRTPPAQRGGAGRFAPTPSGDLHVGNLRTAILAWTWARRTGRRFVLRVEDLDRVQPGAAHRQLADLQAIGLDWDGPVLHQSTRRDAYARALRQLREAGWVFECFCSRSDIRRAASAPHTPPGHYPGTCLRLTAAEREARRADLAADGRAPALRLRAPVEQWTIHDEIHGDVTGPVDHVVLQRGDGTPAYNVAVVVDDGFQGIDQVTRADDLLSHAPAQACLADLLGLPQPTYVHVPLAVAPTGARLAKRDGAVTLADLQELGWSAEDVVEWIGRSLGVRGARSATDIADALDVPALRALPRTPWVVTPPTSPVQTG